MKLYDSPFAPNPRRVRWVMAEKGVTDIEIVALDLMKGEHKQPDYLTKAGLPQLPALELEDGTVVTESIAICRYLESRYPEPNLFGRTPEETAVIEMWLRRAEFLVATPMMQWVRHTALPLAVLETQDPAVAERQQAEGLKGLEVLDHHLAGRQWLAANRLTIADIAAFIGIDFARLIRYRPPETLINLCRWADVMRARPAAKAGMAG
ncbi:glutathione S-transferase family protein [Phenylobacterium sp. LjRoot225]|uniref:glutathione S-transferase family protein n=1 Tax=Phenylobacterium sp. LjRoot225 TaxID=3342285 RepID=UPI003ECE9258